MTAHAKTRARGGPPAPGITVRRSRIDGRGAFATRRFAKGRKIAEYAGERISRAEAARRLHGMRRIRISDLDARSAIDGSVGGNGTQFINHCCEPNCYMKRVRGHVLFFALRDIRPGEEILLDYGSSYHDDRKRCRCGAACCRGRINR